MRVLYLIPSLGCSGASRQVEILARGVAGAQFRLEVCELGPESSATRALRQAGVTVHALNWRRTFDPAALWRLRGLLQTFQPDLVHAWHRRALRMLALVGRKYLTRVVLSQPFSWEQGSRLPRL